MIKEYDCVQVNSNAINDGILQVQMYVISKCDLLSCIILIFLYTKTDNSIRIT